MADESESKPKGRRGFASMDPNRQREIASKGGKSAHAAGRAHTYSSEEAKVAGAQGGKKVSADREHMREIGRKGGSQPKTRRSGTSNAPTEPSSEPAP